MGREFFPGDLFAKVRKRKSGFASACNVENS